MTEAPRVASIWWLLSIGIATGALSGLLGVGGGIIMVPALAALGFTRHRSTATSLAAIFVIAVAGAIAFGVAGDLDVPTAIVLGVGGLVGSTIGAHWMNRLSGVTLARVFGVVLLAAGVRMVLGGGAGEQVIEPNQLVAIGLELLIGVVTGVVSGLAGIGGGIIMIPAMVLLLGIDQHMAEGTSLLAILFTAAAGTRVNMKHRHVDWRAVVILGSTGAILAPIAALAAQRIEADTLGQLFGGFVIITSVLTLWKSESAAPTPA